MRRGYSLLALVLVAAPLFAADGPSVQASHVWVRPAPPGVTVLAGYFTLENLTDAPLKLTGATSPEFAAVEMHQSTVKDGVESMQAVDSVTLPAHGKVEFVPGGYHLMLMQPKKDLGIGSMVTLMLTFSDGSELAILANLRRDPPAH
jgi:copper(I)-binding protein